MRFWELNPGHMQVRQMLYQLSHIPGPSHRGNEVYHIAVWFCPWTISETLRTETGKGGTEQCTFVKRGTGED